jgi:hypothetical protein
MPTRAASASTSCMGLYVLGALLLVLLLVQYTKAAEAAEAVEAVEGFAEKKEKAAKVPKECGTGGFSYMNPMSGSTKPSNRRSYTQQQCEAMKGAWVAPDTCLKLKKMKQDDDGNYDTTAGNIKMDFGAKCGGLNTQTTARPPECKSGGVPNPVITVNIGGKNTKIPANSFMLYTDAECEALGGTFDETGAHIEKAKKALKREDDTLGLCMRTAPDVPYDFSYSCTGTASMVGGASDLAGSFF